MNLGALLRMHRRNRQLTLKSVAEKAGVSEGFLSQVENAVKSPSLDTLRQICTAMEINAGDLINQLDKHENIHTILRVEWDEAEVPHTGFATRRFCPPEDRGTIDSAVLFLQPGATIPVRKDVRNGQEVLCVLKGRLELTQGERTTLLKEGDAAHFWADTNRQSITNTSREMTVALWVGTL